MSKAFSLPEDVSFGSNRGAVVSVLAILIAIAVWLNFPPSVIVFNDDFGYLRSVGETFQRGRPWTDDWLEPWAASLSIVSALIFKISGSFRLAIYGLQSVTVGGIVGMLLVLLRRRGVGLGLSLSWSLLLVSSPSLLYKTSEFGAIPLYVCCLLVALWASERKKWLCFGIAWVVAVSSRQSAVLWVLIPLTMLFLRQQKGPHQRIRTIAASCAILIGAAFIYHLVERGMNRTNAQIVMEQGLFSHVPGWTGVRQAGIALGVGVVAMGLAGFVQFFSSRRNATQPNPSSRWLVASACLVIIVLWIVDVRRWIEIEHGLLQETRGSLYLALIYVLSLAGWILGRFRVHVTYACTALALAGLMVLRAAIWDYYLIEIVVLSFFSVFTPEDGARSPILEMELPFPLIPRFIAFFSIGCLAVFHWAFLARTKILLDEDYAMLVLEERALRSGSISVSDLSTASFGYRGWNLYPYFIAHDGVGQYIANFQHYIHDDASRFQVDGPLEPEPTVANLKLKPGEILLGSQVLPRGWGATRRYNLILTGTGKKSGLSIDPEKYQRPRFPLNDQEWRESLADQ